MSVEILSIEEKKKIFEIWDKGEICLVPIFNFIFSPHNNTGNLEDICKKVFGLTEEENFRIASYLMSNNGDVEKATKAFGEPIKTKDYGEFGERLDSMYIFFSKVNGKIVVFYLDDRGSSFEIEAVEDVSIFDDGPKECNEYFYSIYEHILEYLKEEFSDDFEKYMNLIKSKR